MQIPQCTHTRAHRHAYTASFMGNFYFPVRKGKQGQAVGEAGPGRQWREAQEAAPLFTLGPSVVLAGEGACPDRVVEPSLGQRVAGWLGQTQVEK